MASCSSYSRRDCCETSLRALFTIVTKRVTSVMVKESLYSRLSGNQEIVAAYIRKCSVKRIFIESSVSSMALQLQELMTANQKVCMKI